MDPKTMTDEELAPFVAEAHRRRMTCRDCGGQMKAYHIHICDEDGGANISLSSEAGKALCRIA
jgi:hypothetical protein